VLEVETLQHFEVQKLFHTCGKPVEKVSDVSTRRAACKAFQLCERAKAAHEAGRR
jgi:hypothetical protein